MLKACIGLKQLDFIDRRHCGLPGIPEEVYRHERTLEELLLDYNAIQDLPPVSGAVQGTHNRISCQAELGLLRV